MTIFASGGLEELLRLQQRVTYTGTNPEYMGYAAPGTADGAKGWMIMKFAYDGNSYMISKKFAGGTPNFVHSWIQRESYDYA